MPKWIGRKKKAFKPSSPINSKPFVSTELNSPAPPTIPTASQVPPKWKIWLGGIALLLPWCLLLFQLSFTWETNEQYAHGYLVPLLCLFLLLKIYPKDEEVESPQHRSALQGKFWLILGIPILIAFVPVWLSSRSQLRLAPDQLCPLRFRFRSFTCTLVR